MDEDEDNIVAALRRGEDGWEYAAADEIEALRAENARLREALKPLIKASARLSFAAQTSGGTAGRDEGLCVAIDNLEAPLVNARAAVGETE